MWAAQAPCDLGHQVFRKTQVMEGLLQGLRGLLRLTAVTLQALLRLQATTLAGFGVPFDGSCGKGHGVLLCSVWVFAECGMPKRPCHIPLAAVRAAPPRRHALPGLPAFLWQRYAV